MGTRRDELEALLQLSGVDRLEPVTEIGSALANEADPEPAYRAAVVAALVALVNSGAGPTESRVALGVTLGQLGDPRLSTTEDDSYWVNIAISGRPLLIGQYPVTTDEFWGWLKAGGYSDDGAWSERGRQWRDTRRTLWPDLAKADDATDLVIPNQPAIGLTWFEAEAFANAHDARLLSLDERMQAMRGESNRPYPWGQPFGRGKANTREENAGRPTAVGLYREDRTPEGLFDLAGNVAEWTADEADEAHVIHPGSWNAPSMSAWAKARALVSPKTRSADLGFRVCREG
jgi:formylglycine-generating enzyme required for sulfatase activity